MPCSESRDPRFESLSAGQYDEEKFKKRYRFLYDEALPGERDDLRAALRRAKGTGARAALQAQLTRVEQQIRSEEARRKQKEIQGQVKVRGPAVCRRAWGCGGLWGGPGLAGARLHRNDSGQGAGTLGIHALLECCPLRSPPPPSLFHTAFTHLCCHHSPCTRAPSLPPAQAKERAAVREGKRPFFLKKSEQRRLELLAKYEELQASGKLDKFLEKRRKKNAAKDHRYLPTGRRGGGGGGGGGGED